MIDADSQIDIALCFIRHYMVGDEEQTRIEEEEFWAALPTAWRIRSLVRHRQWNDAIRVYVRTLCTERDWNSLLEHVDRVVEFFSDIDRKELDWGFHDLMQEGP